MVTPSVAGRQLALELKSVAALALVGAVVAAVVAVVAAGPDSAANEGGTRKRA